MDLINFPLSTIVVDPQLELNGTAGQTIINSGRDDYRYVLKRGPLYWKLGAELNADPRIGEENVYLLEQFMHSLQGSENYSIWPHGRRNSTVRSISVSGRDSNNYYAVSYPQGGNISQIQTGNSFYGNGRTYIVSNISGGRIRFNPTRPVLADGTELIPIYGLPGILEGGYSAPRINSNEKIMRIPIAVTEVINVPIPVIGAFNAAFSAVAFD